MRYYFKRRDCPTCHRITNAKRCPRCGKRTLKVWVIDFLSVIFLVGILSMVVAAVIKL